MRFRHGDGAAAVEAEPLIHIAPHVAGDYYHLILRLMEA